MIRSQSPTLMSTITQQSPCSNTMTPRAISHLSGGSRRLSPPLEPFIPRTDRGGGSRNFRLADLVTIMNGFCGSFSLFSSANYCLTGDEYYLHNALLFPLGGLMFDFLDGKVARWRKSSSMLRQELDSL